MIERHSHGRMDHPIPSRAALLHSETILKGGKYKLVVSTDATALQSHSEIFKISQAILRYLLCVKLPEAQAGCEPHSLVACHRPGHKSHQQPPRHAPSGLIHCVLRP